MFKSLRIESVAAVSFLGPHREIIAEKYLLSRSKKYPRWIFLMQSFTLKLGKKVLKDSKEGRSDINNYLDQII
mgnify:CR=1 FL=1